MHHALGLVLMPPPALLAYFPPPHFPRQSPEIVRGHPLTAMHVYIVQREANPQFAKNA